MSASKDELPPEVSGDGSESARNDSRRAALAKMGLYAAYTAPLMLGMMTAAKAAPPSRPPL